MADAAEQLEIEAPDAEADGNPTVAVQVPAYDEPPDVFEAVLDGIAGQVALEGYQVTREAWITPQDDGGAEAELVDVAAGHDAFEAIKAPAGKLSARNSAHDAAIDNGADIVVTWDADAQPAHPRVLAAVLDPFDDSPVVATYGHPRAPRTNPVNIAVNALARMEDLVRPHLNSQIAALSAFAWDEAGKFDAGVDQTDGLAVRREEEFRFYRALERLGEVRHVRSAVVLEEPRRPMHHLNRAMHRASVGRYPLSEWERNRGAVSFTHGHGDAGTDVNGGDATPEDDA